MWCLSVVHQLLWPCNWSARGSEMVATRHTCFGFEKALVVLTGVVPFEMDSLCCISAGSCGGRNK